VDRTQYLQI